VVYRQNQQNQASLDRWLGSHKMMFPSYVYSCDNNRMIHYFCTVFLVARWLFILISIELWGQVSFSVDPCLVLRMKCRVGDRAVHPMSIIPSHPDPNWSFLFFISFSWTCLRKVIWANSHNTCLLLRSHSMVQTRVWKANCMITSPGRSSRKRGKGEWWLLHIYCSLVQNRLLLLLLFAFMLLLGI